MGDHKLYNELALACDEMYSSLFDYDKEYTKFETFLAQNGCKKVIEVGCGAGNVGKRFLEGEKYEYIGVDLSSEMIKLARERNKGGKFIVGDMRKLDKVIPSELVGKADCVIITGRSFTYMTTNEDVLKCLRSIWKVLKIDGVFMFDNFSASLIFKNFKSDEFKHSSKFESRNYIRKNRTTWNLQNGFTWNWEAEYTIEEGGKETKVVKDKAILRSFTKGELYLFLELCGFEVVEYKEDKDHIVTKCKKLKSMLPDHLNKND